MDKEATVTLAILSDGDIFHFSHFTDKIQLIALSYTQKKYTFIYFIS